ncbi:hypothetical protein HETIRDRAFT_475042 [Heterobasidion irregulare TC 32-1]|uniref:Uncharacterized protein n=1 Tax=Heterobasidion irregulare (strain TC 32-1) TaxID=747525 RepID=W4K6Y9_HETIT|nr:uncharacterized protein HETIRDRAFT_475042 [Heterobasidion irregulare TC 32-1]ETW81607.1 hypothetical protein HETIRDRAFT_475042 [Heterobasidion irregulare TC 32-1]
MSSPSPRHRARPQCPPQHIFHRVYDDMEPHDHPPPPLQPPSASLIHILPVELLTRIFCLGYEHVVDPDRPFKRRPREHGTNFEVLVSHVCHHWRTIALQTPSLWTSIRMRKPVHLERSQQFILRSRSRPLDIFIDTVSLPDHVPGHTLSRTEFHPAFDVVDPHSARWRSLILKVSDLVCKAGARDRLHATGPVPNLESVQLWHLEKWDSLQNLAAQTARAPVPVLCSDATAIKDLSLVGVNLAWALHATPYLAGLRSLELKLHAEPTRPTCDQWEAILRASPDLERLALHYSGPREDVQWSTDPIPLPRLAELSIHDLDPDMLCLIMRNMAVPALRALELELTQQDDTDFSAFMGALVDDGVPHVPELRHLRVAALDCSTQSWHTFLKSVPKLTHLEIDFRRMQDELFHTLSLTDAHACNGNPSALSIHSEPPAEADSAPAPESQDPGKETQSRADYVLLPALETLKIAGLSGDYIRDFLEFRAVNGRPIAHVLLHRYARDEDTDALRENQNSHVDYFLYSDEDDDGEDDDALTEFDEEGEDPYGEEEAGEDGEEEEEEEEAAAVQAPPASSTP